MNLSELKSNALLKGPSGKLHRVIWLAPDSERIYVLDVTGKLPRGSRMPERVDWHKFIKVYGKDWASEDISLMTEDMKLPPQELSPEATETRKKNWSAIEPLVRGEAALLTTLDKQTRPAAIAQAAAAANVAVPRIYQLLTRYFWFGCDEAALTPRYKSRGSKKISSGASTRTKRGAPNAVAQLEGGTAYSGRSVTQRDLSRFFTALDKYWAEDMLSIPQTYERMCDNLYVSSNQHEKRGSFEHFVAQRFIPTVAQFKYHSRAIIAEHGLREKREGHLDWAQRTMSRTGSATDITVGPTDVYDMDVVELKCIAVTETNPPEVIGKVKACLAVDRGSRAIVGFYFFLGAESWDHYRLTLFRAFTSTQKHLEQLEYFDLAEKAPTFAADGWCNEVFVDRGPARGHNAFNAIVESLRLGRAEAPTDRGDMKAVVESVNGRFQKQVATLQGGYSRAVGARKRDQAKNAAKFARLTVNQISRFLAAAIADHNAYHNVSHLLTRRMVLDKVEGIPVEIFKWGKKNVMGRTARDRVSDEELYLRLLPSFEGTVSATGIRYNGYRYSSDELIKFRHQNLSKKSLKITLTYEKSDPLRLYWRKPDGMLGVLNINKEGQKKLQGMCGEELHDFRLRELSAAIKRTAKKRQHGFISQTRKELLMEIDRRRFPKDHRPLLTPAANKKIGVYQETLAAREHSRKLLASEGYEDIQRDGEENLAIPSPSHTPSVRLPQHSGGASILQAPTSKIASSATPTSATQAAKGVSKAMANFLKNFIPKASAGDIE